MHLERVHSEVLVPTSPFHFDATFHKPDHFPTNDNRWEPGTRWQTWYWRERSLGLKFRNRGNVEDPRMRVDVYHASAPGNVFLSSLMAEVRYRFNLELELSEFYRDFLSDAVLGPPFERLRGMRPGHPSSLYEYLIAGIVLQNATVGRSIRMMQALYERYGTMLMFDGQRLWCSWAPGALRGVTEDALRRLKVGYRAKSIKRVDDAFASGEVDELELRELDSQAQRKQLLALYGVGPATVGYLLFDLFHHWDILDHISPWEQKIYSTVIFDTDPDRPVPVGALLEFFDRYGRCKALAEHYIWEDLWWKHVREGIPWLDELIRA